MIDDLTIISGALGAGKSTLLAQLGTHIGEPARRVLAQQRAIQGTGTGDQDSALFVDLMLELTIADHDSATSGSTPQLFDRALPDLLAYAHYYKLPSAQIEAACHSHRYNQTVLWLPAWQDIYVTDSERTLDFDAACAFGELVKEGYLRTGYTLLTVPKDTIKARAAFISAHLNC